MAPLTRNLTVRKAIRKRQTSSFRINDVASRLAQLARKSYGAAKREIKEKGLELGKVHWVYADYASEFAIIAHYLREGEPVAPKAKVYLIVCEEA